MEPKGLCNFLKLRWCDIPIHILFWCSMGFPFHELPCIQYSDCHDDYWAFALCPWLLLFSWPRTLVLSRDFRTLSCFSGRVFCPNKNVVPCLTWPYTAMSAIMCCEHVSSSTFVPNWNLCPVAWSYSTWRPFFCTRRCFCFTGHPSPTGAIF
jgi:hypothetical protein